MKLIIMGDYEGFARKHAIQYTGLEL